MAKVDLVNITNAGLKQLGENMDILLDDYKHKTDIDVWDLISKNKFRDESKPYDDERARFMKHVYHRLGYDALPKQVKCFLFCLFAIADVKERSLKNKTVYG